MHYCFYWPVTWKPESINSTFSKVFSTFHGRFYSGSFQNDLSSWTAQIYSTQSHHYQNSFLIRNTTLWQSSSKKVFSVLVILLWFLLGKIDGHLWRFYGRSENQYMPEPFTDICLHQGGPYWKDRRKCFYCEPFSDRTRTSIWLFSHFKFLEIILTFPFRKVLLMDIPYHFHWLSSFDINPTGSSGTS